MSLIQTLVRRELSNVFISIVSMILLYVLTKFAVKSVEEFVTDNKRMHNAHINRATRLDYALYNMHRQLDELECCSDTSSESSDESSEDSESVPDMVSRDYGAPERV